MSGLIANGPLDRMVMRLAVETEKMMDDDQKWSLLQREAERNARRELLEALLAATGLDEYIASAIGAHERQNHEDA